MSLATFEEDVKTKLTEVKDRVESILTDHLPEVASLAKAAEGNPLVDAALSAVHVSPDILQGLADTLTKLDAALAPQATTPTAPAAGSAPATAEADDEAPAADSASEPAAPAPVPAGPQVAGVA